MSFYLFFLPLGRSWLPSTFSNFLLSTMVTLSFFHSFVLSLASTSYRLGLSCILFVSSDCLGRSLLQYSMRSWQTVTFSSYVSLASSFSSASWSAFFSWYSFSFFSFSSLRTFSSLLLYNRAFFSFFMNSIFRMSFCCSSNFTLLSSRALLFSEICSLILFIWSEIYCFFSSIWGWIKADSSEVIL